MVRFGFRKEHVQEHSRPDLQVHLHHGHYCFVLLAVRVREDVRDAANTLLLRHQVQRHQSILSATACLHGAGLRQQPANVRNSFDFI